MRSVVLLKRRRTGSDLLGREVAIGLAVLVQFKLGDDDLAEVDVDLDGGAVHLLPGNPLDVDDPLPAIHLFDLAVSALVGPRHHLHLFVLAHRDRPRVVLVAVVGRERCAHQHAPDVRRSSEVLLPVLPPGA
ncbi:hypothetical protein BHE74_00012614 [Ensete ventricosum]|nr:hypothetical protein BHE74_00012614 [Ensete ventricosum]